MTHPIHPDLCISEPHWEPTEVILSHASEPIMSCNATPRVRGDSHRADNSLAPRGDTCNTAVVWQSQSSQLQTCAPPQPCCAFHLRLSATLPPPPLCFPVQCGVKGKATGKCSGKLNKAQRGECVIVLKAPRSTCEPHLVTSQLVPAVHGKTGIYFLTASP